MDHGGWGGEGGGVKMRVGGWIIGWGGWGRGRDDILVSVQIPLVLVSMSAL